MGSSKNIEQDFIIDRLTNSILNTVSGDSFQTEVIRLSKTDLKYVAGNLVAYACKISFQRGFDGYVAFTAKTKLIDHYEKTLGAYHFKNQRMIIETQPAKILVEKYFKI
jgi:hypothetical protein